MSSEDSTPERCLCVPVNGSHTTARQNKSMEVFDCGSTTSVWDDVFSANATATSRVERAFPQGRDGDVHGAQGPDALEFRIVVPSNTRKQSLAITASPSVDHAGATCSSIAEVPTPCRRRKKSDWMEQFEKTPPRGCKTGARRMHVVRRGRRPPY